MSRAPKRKTPKEKFNDTVTGSLKGAAVIAIIVIVVWIMAVGFTIAWFVFRARGMGVASYLE